MVPHKAPIFIPRDIILTQWAVETVVAGKFESDVLFHMPFPLLTLYINYNLFFQKSQLFKRKENAGQIIPPRIEIYRRLKLNSEQIIEHLG